MSKLSLKVLLGVFALLFSGVGDVIASDFPDCPSSGYFHNCFGTYTLRGNEYAGEFKDNKKNGQGTYTFANGQKYVGEFKDEKFNGQGTYTFPNGNKYVGEFKDEKFDGQGTYTFANGQKYVGEFKDGKRNGQGTYTFPSGTVKEGIWKNDEFQYAQKLSSSSAPEQTPKLDIAKVKASFDEKDYTKAFEDAQVLAVQGEAEAQLLLGKMYADGRGTIQVSTMAHMWFNIASMGGIDEAYEQRKAITGQMTPAAVEEAQKMAMKCIQSTYADCGLAVKPVAVKQTKPVAKTYFTSGSQVEPWFRDETQLKRKQLHYALKKLGVYNSSVDGLWGANTARAFTKYIDKYKRDAENVDEIFASILSKVKVPSTFSTPKKSYSSSSSSGNNSSSRSTSSNNAGLTAVVSNPSMSGEQAMAICKPQAKLAYNNAVNSDASDRRNRDYGSTTRCTSFTRYSMNCNTTSNSGGPSNAMQGVLLGLTVGLKAKRVAETVLESCLAQYGWKE